MMEEEKLEKYEELEDQENEDSTFNMRIDSELKKQFNIKCIENNTQMSKEIKKFIKEYLK